MVTFGPDPLERPDLALRHSTGPRGHLDDPVAGHTFICRLMDGTHETTGQGGPTRTASQQEIMDLT